MAGRKVRVNVCLSFANYSALQKLNKSCPRQFNVALAGIEINRVERCIVPRKMEGLMEVAVGSRCTQYVMSCNRRPNGATPDNLCVG